MERIQAVAPVAAQERIESMDVLRGAAVLGILLWRWPLAARVESLRQ